MSEDTERGRKLDRARKAAAETVDRSKEAARARLEQARERFRGVAAHAGDQVREAADSARTRGDAFREHTREGASKARRVARDRYDDAVGQLQDGYADLRDQADGWSAGLVDAIRNHPGRAVLTATLAGFVVGLLLSDGDDGYEDDLDDDEDDR